MVGQGLMDGFRRAGAILALLAVATFMFLAAPSHAEPIPAADTPAMASAHHAGDGDPDAAHHMPGAHCSSHCGGHVATPDIGGVAIETFLPGRQRFLPVDDDARATLNFSPPIRPPAI